MKASKHSNTFVINVLSKNRARKPYSLLDELVLTLNWFSFGDNYYKQINGVAMGTKMGPSYANLFLGFIENKFFSNRHGQNLIFTSATSMASVPLHPAEKNLTYLLTQSILFTRL